ncbi:coenzyme F420-0:L-glutamate ligase [Nocardioides piscis]|uniref:Coenzyme F420-0:L-glutamate ligase n=1 Tax=Nocardioides piscis TaxID=2714938 RepID=A0A6G7YG65_9ACTN|nr:coenzyme F420-0:L-glutamate ligase [Nocardioides piscis]QIK75597.1 coenzyme F420-0:L-glutamate ligase [Nocardioides piscis]
MTAPEGLPEITVDSDLAALIVAAVDLLDGDVVVVTSKVVSKAEGRVRTGDRDSALAEETQRVVARRGTTTIVRNRLGLTMAAAGIDASNVAAGSIVLLPIDPDASARTLRRRIHDLTGTVVAVVVTDTAGRAWRDGQTDIAIGAAGLQVAVDHAGLTDSYGNELAVTLPAVADEIASAADLVRGKLGGRPVAVLRGRADLVLPLDDAGPGAASLVRPDGADLFGYGAREAVVRALAGDLDDQAAFGARAERAELAQALARVPAEPASRAAVCFAHGWTLEDWQAAQPDGAGASPPHTP